MADARVMPPGGSVGLGAHRLLTLCPAAEDAGAAALPLAPAIDPGSAVLLALMWDSTGRQAPSTSTARGKGAASVQDFDWRRMPAIDGNAKPFVAEDRFGPSCARVQDRAVDAAGARETTQSELYVPARRRSNEEVGMKKVSSPKRRTERTSPTIKPSNPDG